jgi:dual specificity phosphatase 12
MAFEHIIQKHRSNSRGFHLDRHAIVFPRILLGPACYLNPVFVNTHNITHIVNCADDQTCPTWAKRWVGDKNYACINAVDHVEYQILDHCYDYFSHAMDTFLRDPTCKNIYVHCQAGMNRSACLVLAYVCQKFRISMEFLVESTARQRPCILTNPGFQKQLLDLK